MDERRQVSFDDGKFFNTLNKSKDNMLSFAKIEELFGLSVKNKFSEIAKGSTVLRFPSA